MSSTALVVETHGVGLGRCVVILAQGVSYPVVAQEQAPHVGMVDEDDAEIVVDLALVEVGHMPQVAYGVEHGLLTVVGGHAYRYVVAVACRGEVVHYAESLGPVHTYKRHEVVKVEFRILFEGLGQCMPLGIGNIHQQPFPLLENGFGEEPGDVFLNVCHIYVMIGALIII